MVNKYYEYKKWSFFWGLMLDQEKEIQQVIDRHNSEGWKVVQFEWSSSKMTVFKWILVLFVTAITLGFVSYWIGFAIIFERIE